MASNNQRGYTAGRFAMDLGGQFAGWIGSIEGGHATSDVVSPGARLKPGAGCRAHLARVEEWMSGRGRTGVRGGIGREGARAP